MYFSLNKKILYSLIVFLLLLVLIFFVIFSTIYAKTLQDNRSMAYMRNQYVVNILVDSLRVKQQLSDIVEQYPELAEQRGLQISGKEVDILQKELSAEQQLNEELRRSYDSNREVMLAGAKIISASLIIVTLLIILLIILLNYWVIAPVEKLINISHNVSAGIFSKRLEQKSKHFKDEFDVLFSTFNTMLENTERNIEETKFREQFLQQLLDAIPEGIRVIDKDYNVIMANKAAYSLLSINGSCIGKKCYTSYGFDCDVCPQSIYTCPIQYLKKENKDLHTIHEVGKVPVHISATKLHLGKIPENYYIIEALHDLRGDVRFSHRQKVSSLAFLSTSIAHEMKNNLGAIRLILEGILDNDYKNIPDDDDKKKYLLMAYNQLVETVKTPERLLKLAQYSENDTATVDIGSAVKDMMLMIDYDAKRRGIDIVTDLSHDLYFIGNESDFKMIILNLAQNAIKAMPNGGILRVTGNKSDKLVILNISDSGIGISAESLKHIFEPFYSANDYAKSSGLGLAIVKSLMEKAKGEISVKSKLHKGTRFTLKFTKAQKTPKS